ncbi:MAG: carbohydrate ABC transporter permease, partial [Schleiferilactobacillus harbinensis]|nr:carbohydrate ABC transporter permease [Schleiferilactobacillus harbinensis]
MDMKMYSKFDRHVLVVNRIIIGFLVIITVIPLVYVTVASFMDPATLLNKGISFNPADWTTQGYQRVFADHSIVRGFLNS